MSPENRDLADRLRVLAIHDSQPVGKLMGEAADAVEQLATMVDNLQSYYKITHTSYARRYHDLEASRKEAAHWMANHDQQVARCSLLRQRPDLPVDRIPAYAELVRLQEENAELKVRLELALLPAAVREAMVKGEGC